MFLGFFFVLFHFFRLAFCVIFFIKFPNRSLFFTWTLTHKFTWWTFSEWKNVQELTRKSSKRLTFHRLSNYVWCRELSLMKRVFSSIVFFWKTPERPLFYLVLIPEFAYMKSNHTLLLNNISPELKGHFFPRDSTETGSHNATTDCMFFHYKNGRLVCWPRNLFILKS